jgi:hypothetical protein
LITQRTAGLTSNITDIENQVDIGRKSDPKNIL